MVEVSNTTLAVLVFAALVVVVAGTVINLNREQIYSNDITGFASSDTGSVNLTIIGSLNIQVNPGNNSINFGTCTPRGATSYWCASNDSAMCSGNNTFGNCSGDNATIQFIRVDNVGSLNASVNVSSTCTAATLIGGTSPLVDFYTDSCNGTNVTTWTALTTTTALACPNIVPTTGKFKLYVNVTIPNDAVGATGGCTSPATLTFQAV